MGAVEFAGPFGDYGNVVILRAIDGVDTWYAHLSAIAVRLTEDVRQGEVIGYVGSTGKSTGDHLHFEVREAKGTLPIDPQQVLGFHVAEPGANPYPDDESGLPEDFGNWVTVRVGVLELPTLSYVTRDGQTMVHLRSLMEALEGEVGWDDATQKATVGWKGKTLKLIIGQLLVEVDGRTVMTYHPPSLWSGNLMVPLRLVAESFGMRVDWDHNSGAVVSR